MTDRQRCPEFPGFGANYNDACCIDGYLWDLDSCDDPGGPLTSGGERPCPFCNAEECLDDASSEQRDNLNEFREKYGFPPVESQ